MAKVLGYLIGGLFVIGILFGPGIGFYFVSIDSFKALNFDASTTGRIVDCTSIRIKGTSNVRYRRVPIVEFNDNQKVYGTVDEINYLYECDSQIGKSVEVLFNKANPKEAKINTFLEMWFLPSILGIICLILYPVFIKGYIKKFNKRS